MRRLISFGLLLVSSFACAPATDSPSNGDDAGSDAGTDVVVNDTFAALDGDADPVDAATTPDAPAMDAASTMDGAQDAGDATDVALDVRPDTFDPVFPRASRDGSRLTANVLHWASGDAPGGALRDTRTGNLCAPARIGGAMRCAPLGPGGLSFNQHSFSDSACSTPVLARNVCDATPTAGTPLTVRDQLFRIGAPIPSTETIYYNGWGACVAMRFDGYEYYRLDPYTDSLDLVTFTERAVTTPSVIATVLEGEDGSSILRSLRDRALDSECTLVSYVDGVVCEPSGLSGAGIGFSDPSCTGTPYAYVNTEALAFVGNLIAIPGTCGGAGTARRRTGTMPAPTTVYTKDILSGACRGDPGSVFGSSTFLTLGPEIVPPRFETRTVGTGQLLARYAVIAPDVWQFVHLTDTMHGRCLQYRELGGIIRCYPANSVSGRAEMGFSDGACTASGNYFNLPNTCDGLARFEIGFEITDPMAMCPTGGVSRVARLTPQNPFSNAEGSCQPRVVQPGLTWYRVDDIPLTSFVELSFD